MTTKDINEKYNKSMANAEMGENVNRIVLEAGKTTLVHLLDLDYQEGYFHWIVDTEGVKRKITCHGGNTKAERKISHEVCPVCAQWRETEESDIAPKHRYMYNAIQGELITRKDKKRVIRWDKLIRLFDIGPQIFNQIGVIQVDEDYPNVDEIYLKVTRKGKGINTDYQVLASPKPSPLPSDLEGEEYDIVEFAEKASLKEVYKILGQGDENSEDEEVVDEEMESFGEDTSNEDEQEFSDQELDEVSFDDSEGDELEEIIE